MALEIHGAQSGFTMASEILWGQENINLLGWKILPHTCHNTITLRSNKVTQCHNIGLLGRHTGNFLVEIQRYVLGRK